VYVHTEVVAHYNLMFGLHLINMAT
jgi:hypothetical protein